MEARRVSANQEYTYGTTTLMSRIPSTRIRRRNCANGARHPRATNGRLVTLRKVAAVNLNELETTK